MYAIHGFSFMLSFRMSVNAMSFPPFSLRLLISSTSDTQYQPIKFCTNLSRVMFMTLTTDGVCKVKIMSVIQF